MALFSRKVAKDFNLSNDVKNPKFMVVTAVMPLVSRKGGSARWADSVIYVLERNSGKAACYGIRMPPNLISQDKVYQGTLEGLDVVKLRQARVRDGG